MNILPSHMPNLEPVSLRAPDLLVQAVSDGRRIGLQLHYVAGMGRALQQAGAWWAAGRRMWALEPTDPEQLVHWLRTVYRGQHVDLDDALPLLRAAVDSPEPDYFAQLLDVQVFPLAKGDMARGRHAVSFAFDTPCVRAVKALQGHFHRHASAWQVQGSASEILDALRRFAGVASEFVFIHEQPVVLEDLVGSTSQASPIKVPAAPPEFGGGGTDEAKGVAFMSAQLDDCVEVDVDEAELARIAVHAGLRDYQVAGVRHLASQTGACLGDDMGLGKSRQAVVATRMAAGEGRVLILCPASLRINWEREIRAVYPDAIVGMVGEDRMATLHGCEWIIANYERLGGLVRETDLQFAVMAVDEAHYLKEHHAGRTRNAFIMATRIPRRYVISGTPLLNREIELHTLLRLTGHRLGQMPLKDFRGEYTGTREKRALLAGALKGWMLRRRKDVLKDLGTKSRQVRYISPAEGLGAYEAIHDDMTLQAMPKITKLRQALEALKTPFLIETVEGLSEGDKIIVFCEYMATVEAMKGAFAAAGIQCVTLVGSDSATKRQKAIDAFQNDPAVTVFIGTTSAAGVGITLTAANYVAFASLPWTPALMRQAEDRAYRLGQRRNVMVIVPLIAGTLDEGVWKLLDRKQETERDVVEAEMAEPGGANAAAAGESPWLAAAA
ncbi:DEAD/DEAH box helicase [Acidovorax sp. SUPP1855]|uniref:DEAD/DEAH box helicase n=1 Tax=Acidovorax sp. SUPP1855 TaxID=431774 RepID=UPI0023DE51AC|nr:DEAD/DEAH box helicase [Acidovorax sp. SUPP1855]GKS86972.1 DEAD/DEAH box helicase [Acidovorax sp. SUPP1855]